MFGLIILIWLVYLTLGISWLSYTVKKELIKEYNVIGTFIIMTFWPIHLFYTKFKK